MKIDLDPDAWAPPKKGAAGGSATRAPTFLDQTLAGRLREVLTRKTESVSASLHQGAPPTLEAYRQMVGELSGLNQALSALTDVEREMSGGDAARTKDDPLYVA